MLIQLKKYDKQRLINCSADEIIETVIGIIYKYSIKYEKENDLLHKQIKTQRFLNINRNKLLNLVIYRGLGFHYNKKELEQNPEGYIERIEELIDSKQVNTQKIRKTYQDLKE